VVVVVVVMVVVAVAVGLPAGALSGPLLKKPSEELWRRPLPGVLPSR